MGMEREREALHDRMETRKKRKAHHQQHRARGASSTPNKNVGVNHPAAPAAILLPSPHHETTLAGGVSVCVCTTFDTTKVIGEFSLISESSVCAPAARMSMLLLLLSSSPSPSSPAAVI